MVKALHRAGIEVILDVVYNHTAEGNHLGPMLSFRGVDNQSYYRLVPDDPRFYMDYTGTGNTLNPVHPTVLRLIMDSLRYFVTECHVDGFRFDLASALAREFYEVDRLSAFFDIIHQDPILSQVKLIAEPWDVGPGGYQVGNFPILWSEWNGIYRDTMRDFWRGRAPLRDFASRFGGSADLYQTDGRRPFASINFITAHDGFTLRDLVSYNDKHNEANGEDNRDGTDDNRSWNCGVEGPTDDPAINALRARQQRNFLATLLLSQGVPMLLGGDEIGRTQGGNNNAWCQDNEISWFDWEQLRPGAARVHAPADRAAPRASRLPAHEVLRGQGRAAARRLVVAARRAPDDAARLGQRRGARDRRLPERRRDRTPRRRHGEEVRDDSFLLLFNAHYEEITFRLPARRFGARWELVLATGPAARATASTPGRRRRWSSRARLRAAPACAEFRATYRLQLTPEFGFAAARELVPYLRDLGDLAPLPLAVAAGARGLAARLRRRRSAPHLRRARRRGGVPRARAARASA